ncbi:MAG: MBL fold metallo-hydrolase [Deltaproteobacteria bacterium]|nr:MBL fold metallo-hydrolase [Deltaproteobacteria bacterium]MBW2676673.1 MBL fold metallo-hydrolase [Deltaproteobacteria bacterium]
MKCKARFEEHGGVLCVIAEDPKWPSPANFYVIPHGNRFAMIDVGCGGSDGAGYLKDALTHWGLRPADCSHVVLSHSHPDHMGAIGWLLKHARPRVFIHGSDVKGAMDPSHLNATFDIPFAIKTCVPHPGFEGFAGLDILDYFNGTGCSMDRTLKVEAVEDGDRLALGEFVFEVMHTPGHSPGHIALHDREKGLLLPGDMVGAIPAWYTPASGGLKGYLESLDKLAAANARRMLPAHGPVIEDPGRSIEWVRGKLLEREKQILEILSNENQSFVELNAALFHSPFIQFFPGCGILESHLIKLEEEGRISRKDGNERIVRS